MEDVHVLQQLESEKKTTDALQETLNTVLVQVEGTWTSLLKTVCLQVLEVWCRSYTCTCKCALL